MNTPSLKIGSVVVKGGNYADHPWTQCLGLEAPRVVWRLPVDDATVLLAGPSEVTITLTASDGTVKKIERVYVVGEEHSPDALIRSVILTDVRFYLPFGWVRASYNVTVPSGTGRQTQVDGIVNPNLLPKVANVTFAPTSLKGSDDGPVGVAWNGQQIAEDMLKKACTGHDFKPIQTRNLARPRSNFVPNDVYVDSDGQTALGQALGALGGLDIRVADDGAIELVDAYLGAEKPIVDPIVAAYSLEAAGVLRWISMSPVAPRKGLVLMTRRCDVRAESLEVQPAARYTAVCDNTIWGTTNDPVLINVAQVTDQALPVPSSVPANIGGGTTPIQGTLLAMDALIDAIAALNDQPPSTKPISRQALLAGFGGTISSSLILSGRLGMLYVQADAAMNAGAGPNVLWIQRLSQIVGCLRRCFKLNPVFARLCRKGSIKAERAALLDAVQQTRQPATAFCDYVQRPKTRGLSKQDKFGWGQNSVPPNSPNVQDFTGTGGIKAYSEGVYYDAPFPITAATASPFVVNVTDPTQGVFYLSDAKTDTSKLHHEAENEPGLVWRLPNVNYSTRDGDSLALWEQAKQLLTHRVSLIFSAVPLGQNNKSALHSYEVSVADALARLGAPPNAVSARAPAREIRVREGVTEARIPWVDSQRQDILACFAQTGFGDPSRLVPVNDQQLRDFAVSVFANYMATVLDHYEGTMTIGFSPKVKPQGSLRQVTHVLHGDGRIYTTFKCDGVATATPPENLMLQSSRNIIFGGIATS